MKTKMTKQAGVWLLTVGATVGVASAVLSQALPGSTGPLAREVRACQINELRVFSGEAASSALTWGR